VVDLAEVIECFLDLRVSGEALARLLDLLWGFEQERLHLPFGEAAVEIKEGAVLGAVSMAMALGFATLHIPLDQGSVEDFCGELKGAQQAGLALAQSQGGSAGEILNPTHMYKRDTQNREPCKQKENAPDSENALSRWTRPDWNQNTPHLTESLLITFSVAGENFVLTLRTSD
jgi:hypothetical protein